MPNSLGFALPDDFLGIDDSFEPEVHILNELVSTNLIAQSVMTADVKYHLSVAMRKHARQTAVDTVKRVFGEALPPDADKDLAWMLLGRAVTQSKKLLQSDYDDKLYALEKTIEKMRNDLGKV